VNALPLSANEVDITRLFDDSELLFRRVAPEELNSKGELEPTQIKAMSFGNAFPSCPSVLRSDFSQPEDVLHNACSGQDLVGWFIFFVTVGNLPSSIKSGDLKKEYQFFPVHLPEPNCGAHSVIACALAGDPLKVYAKPSYKVYADFKIKLALALRPIVQTYDHATREPLN
jgi:hypothetical protein